MATPGKERNVKVFVRVRPGKSTETERTCLSKQGNQTLLIGPRKREFTFDSVLDGESTQEEVFQTVGKSITDNCLRGYNGTIFAYGQTGSGKTFTIQGPGSTNAAEAVADVHRGLAPRILQNLFSLMERDAKNSGGAHQYSVKCSLLEIYNEKITDLLQPHLTNLRVLDKADQGRVIDGAKEQEVTCAEEAIGLLLSAAKHRHVSATGMNDQSSRSHMIFSVYIRATKTSRANGDSTTITKVQYSRLNLVDLAGSERQKMTKATGIRLKEATMINKSLTNLGLVIRALVEVAKGKQAHVHYRDSKLTYLLKDSLGGNSKTSIIATVSPADASFQETLATLKFAERAKKIKNKAVVNENIKASVSALQTEILRLRKELQAAKSASPPRAPAPSMPSPQIVTKPSASPLAGEPSKDDQELVAKIVQLEKILQGSMEKELQRQQEKKELEERILKLEKLVREKEQYLSANKRFLKARNDTIEKLLKTDISEATDEARNATILATVREKEDLLEEISTLKMLMENHPKVTEVEIKAQELRENLTNYDAMFSDDLVQYREQVMQLELARDSLRDDVKQLIEEKHGILKNLTTAVLTSPKAASPIRLSSGRRYPMGAFTSPRMVKKSKQLENWRQQMLDAGVDPDSELKEKCDRLRQEVDDLRKKLQENDEVHTALEASLREEVKSAQSILELQDEALQEQIAQQEQFYSSEQVQALIAEMHELKDELDTVCEEVLHKQDLLLAVEKELAEVKENENLLLQQVSRGLDDLTNAEKTIEQQTELIESLQQQAGNEEAHAATLKENRSLRQELTEVHAEEEQQRKAASKAKAELEQTTADLESLTKKHRVLMTMVSEQQQNVIKSGEVIAEKEEQLTLLLKTQQETEAELARVQESREEQRRKVLEQEEAIQALQNDAKDVDALQRNQMAELEGMISEQQQEMASLEEALANREDDVTDMSAKLEVLQKEKHAAEEEVAATKKQLADLLGANEREVTLQASFEQLQATSGKEIAALTEQLASLRESTEAATKRMEADNLAMAELAAAHEQQASELQGELAETKIALDNAGFDQSGLAAELEETKAQLAEAQRQVADRDDEKARVAESEQTTFESLMAVETKHNQLQEKHEQALIDLAALKKLCKELSEENGRISGHRNQKQKIQHFSKVKNENTELKAENSKLKMALKAMRAGAESAPLADITSEQTRTRSSRTLRSRK